MTSSASAATFFYASVSSWLSPTSLRLRFLSNYFESELRLDSSKIAMKRSYSSLVWLSDTNSPCSPEQAGHRILSAFLGTASFVSSSTATSSCYPIICNDVLLRRQPHLKPIANFTIPLKFCWLRAHWRRSELWESFSINIEASLTCLVSLLNFVICLNSLGIFFSNSRLIRCSLLYSRPRLHATTGALRGSLLMAHSELFAEFLACLFTSTELLFFYFTTSLRFGIEPPSLPIFLNAILIIIIIT